MSDIVSWDLQLAVRDGRLEDLRALVKEMVASTRAEEGTEIFEWYLSADGKACHIYERYADSAAALVHLGTFGSTFAERFLACLEPTAFNVYGNPSAEVRGVLDGFGAAYLGWLDGFAR